MRIAAAVVIALLAASTVFAQDDGKTRPRINKIKFGSIETGIGFPILSTIDPSYQKGESAKWTDFAARDPKEKIWAPPPVDMSLSRRVLERMIVTPVSSGAAGCDRSPRGLLISTPPDGPGERLYAYEYIVCDETGLLNAGMMADQYIAKYGLYDTKDYDLGMIIYNNVHGRYRVGVRPGEPVDGRAAVVITIVDGAVFSDAYFAWKQNLGKAYESARSLF